MLIFLDYTVWLSVTVQDKGRAGYNLFLQILGKCIAFDCQGQWFTLFIADSLSYFKMKPSKLQNQDNILQYIFKEVIDMPDNLKWTLLKKKNWIITPLNFSEALLKIYG